jgi:hypothetical protein
MIAIEPPRRLFGVLELVVLRRSLEADAESRQRPRHRLAHESHDHRRVETAAEEGAQGNVGDEPLANGVAQERRKPLDRFRKTPDSIDLEGGAPVALRRPLSRRSLDHHPGRGCEHLHVGIGGKRLREVPVRQVVGKGVEVRLAGHRRVALDGLDLGGEEETPAVLVEVERFLPAPVPGEEQAVTAGIPDGEGEHSVETANHVLTLPGEELENDFGVAPGSKARSGVRKLAPELAKVVDLAVEHDGQVAALVPHGLIGPARKVDDAEPPVPEADFSRHLDSATIGAAMGKGVGHRFEGRAVGRRPGSEAERAYEAAHEGYPTPAATWASAVGLGTDATES